MKERQQHRIVGLGELLWDLLPTGPKLGGAPANFACHAQQLGASSAMVSCVGADDRGKSALQELESRSLDTSCILRSELPTGTVEITLSQDGQPTYKIVERVAWDEISWTTALAELATKTDVACFGSLGQRSTVSRQTIQQFLRQMPSDSLRIFDVNLRPPHFDDNIVLQSLDLANVLKLNSDELLVLKPLCQLSGGEGQMLQQLAARFSLQLVALTRGSEGAMLADQGAVIQQEAYPTTVIDTVGAGDSFTAVLALGLLKGRSWHEIAAAASRVAAYVCSQPGATPSLPAELIPWRHECAEEDSR